MSPTEGVLGEAWSLYKAHWRHLLAISFVVYAVLAVVNALLVLTLTWVGALISVVLLVVGLFWLQGALVRAVEDVRDGRADRTLGETFQLVRPQIGAIAVAGILAALGIAAGLILLIVPGLVLMTWWVVVIPVVVLEGSSAGASFGRSRELVRGFGWNVFGVIILTILLLIAFSIVLSLILSPLADWLRGFLANVVSGTLTAPFIGLVWTLLYYRLRDTKAGLSGAEPAPPTPTA